MAKKKRSYQPAPYNPRRISREALEGLEESLKVFGDLSGFVINRRTGHVICGNQRREALGAIDLAEVNFGKPYQVELGHAGERFRSPECEGIVRLPLGARYRVRRVNWYASFEKQANVAANNPHIQGEFTDQVEALLKDIREESPGALEALRLQKLMGEAKGESAGTDVSEIPPAIQFKPPREYVLVMCADDGGEEFDRLKELLGLRPVRRGGYRPGSPFDKVGTQRVVHAADLLERLEHAHRDTQ